MVGRAGARNVQACVQVGKGAVGVLGLGLEFVVGGWRFGVEAFGLRNWASFCGQANFNPNPLTHSLYLPADLDHERRVLQEGPGAMHFCRCSTHTQTPAPYTCNATCMQTQFKRNPKCMQKQCRHRATQHKRL